MDKQEYSDKLKDPLWLAKRRVILQRDDGKCVKCGSTKEPLNVHHKYYTYNTEVWDYPNDALITLCPDCHKQEHILLDELTQKLLNIFRRVFSPSEIYHIINAVRICKSDFSGGDLSKIIATVFKNQKAQDYIFYEFPFEEEIERIYGVKNDETP